MKYYIVDRYSSDVGFAVNDPIEGWIFTIIKNHATTFNTQKEAQEAIDKHYARYKRYLKVELMKT